MPKEVVAKLGFSWESKDVCFSAADPLTLGMTLLKLFGRGVHDTCIVQEVLDVRCELRYHVLNGRVQDVRPTRFPQRCGNCSAPSCFQRLPQSLGAVARCCFDGDIAFSKAVDRRCRELIGLLLCWLGQEHVGLGDPPYLRFDFMVAASTTTSGQSLGEIARLSVYLGEIGELGSSMCGWEEGRNYVFEAALAKFFQRCSSKCSRKAGSCSCHLAAKNFDLFAHPASGKEAWLREEQRMSGVSDVCCLPPLVSLWALLLPASARWHGPWRLALGAEREDRERICAACGVDDHLVHCEECKFSFCRECLANGQAECRYVCGHCGFNRCSTCTARVG